MTLVWVSELKPKRVKGPQNSLPKFCKKTRESGSRNLVRLPSHSVNCHGPVVGNIYPILLKEVREIRVVPPPLFEESLRKRLIVLGQRSHGLLL